MKKIMVRIDDRVFEDLTHQRLLRQQMDGCFRAASNGDQIVDAMVAKIQAGGSMIDICVPNEPLQ